MGAGDVKVVRALTNNVVLAVDDAGGEVILTGRGLGYGARPGQEVDAAKVVRTFAPVDGRERDHLASILAGIPPEHIDLVARSMTDAGLEARATASPTLVVALADHLSFALRRLELGLHVDYPLLGEVRNLYPDEYAAATALLTALNRRSERALPDAEAVALALHLVNAGFSTGDLAFTYTMTGVIQQLIDVIAQTYGIELDLGSVSVGRFITHLRYLFVRVAQHRQLDEQQHSTIGDAIRDAYPVAVECAARLAAIIELRFDSALTEDEVSYLTLHVARVASNQA